MTSLFDLHSESDSHLSDDLLTRMISHELPQSRRVLARRHVDGCWQCRARFAQLAHSAIEVAEYRRQVIKRLGPPSSARRDLFIRQLDVALDSLPPTAWWKRLSRQFLIAPFGNSAPSFTSTLAIICAGLILFAAWRWQLPVVSAAEFLDRAAVSDQSSAKLSGSGVIRQRLRVKTPKRTMEHDAYRDTSGLRHLQNTQPDPEDADLFVRLAFAGVNWDDPLSGASFKDWHDRQVNPKDEVRSSGDGLLTISTRLPSTSIAEESLTVWQDGFHPVKRTIDYREAGTIEISEVSIEFLSWNRANQILLNSLPEMHPAPPRVIARAMLPSRTQMDETELEARLVLNQQKADTGEQIEISRDSKGVEIEGVVETDKRKDELKGSLDAIPFLSVTIRTFDDLKSSSRTTARAQVTVSQEQTSVAQVSPLEQYLVQHSRSRDDLSRISAGLFRCSLAINRSSRALEELSVRFSTVGDLSPTAIHARDELFSGYVTRILDDLSKQQQLLGEADFAIGSLESDPGSPEPVGAGLAHLAERNSAATRELISGAGESSRSATRIAADLAATILLLRSAALDFIPGHSK